MVPRPEKNLGRPACHGPFVLRDTPVQGSEIHPLGVVRIVESGGGPTGPHGSAVLQTEEVLSREADRCIETDRDPAVEYQHLLAIVDEEPTTLEGRQMLRKVHAWDEHSKESSLTDSGRQNSHVA